MTATQDQHFDIVIAGAGIIGATMALALADTGLQILLLDARPESPATDRNADQFDPRVSAITHASQRLFESLGAWSAMQQRLCAYTHMHVREADGTGQIDFDASEIHAESIGHIIENSVIVAALEQSLSGIANINRRFNAQVSAYSIVCDAGPGVGAKLTLTDGQSITAALIIAADGANSALRGMAKIRVRDWDYGHHAIVTTVRTERGHGQTARQIFRNDGVLAFLPLCHDSQQYSSIVWSLQPARATAVMALSDHDFCEALSLASEHWSGQVLSTARRLSFPLRQRHAVEYVRGPLVLIGDAAHSIHPLAGQGANLGLQDAQALASELHRAVRTGRPLHDTVILSRYQRQRQPANLAMMAAMEGFRHLYADQPLMLRWLRNTGMRAVDALPLIKQQLMRQVLG
jgi:2-octaprenylphenol hydroxylase